MDEIFNRIMDLATAGLFVWVIIKLNAIESYLEDDFELRNEENT